MKKKTLSGGRGEILTFYVFVLANRHGQPLYDFVLAVLVFMFKKRTPGANGDFTENLSQA